MWACSEYGIASTRGRAAAADLRPPASSSEVKQLAVMIFSADRLVLAPITHTARSASRMGATGALMMLLSRSTTSERPPRDHRVPKHGAPPWEGAAFATGYTR
jgi:hypothetical protein